MDSKYSVLRVLIFDSIFANFKRLTNINPAFQRDDLPDVIRSIMEAVKFGELDIQIEDVAEKGGQPP